MTKCIQISSPPSSHLVLKTASLLYCSKVSSYCVTLTVYFCKYCSQLVKNKTRKSTLSLAGWDPEPPLCFPLPPFLPYGFHRVASLFCSLQPQPCVCPVPSPHCQVLLFHQLCDRLMMQNVSQWRSTAKKKANE